MNNSEEYYDNLSTVYDEATDKKGDWMPPDVVYNSIKSYLKKGSKVFDFGIGTGKSIAKILEFDEKAEIYGVDVSRKMLNICNTVYPNIVTSKITEISDLRSISEKFDILISSGAIEFIEEIEELIIYFYELTKKGGVISITYEPVIEFHAIQSQHKSLTVSSQNSSFHVNNFYTYRHIPSHFNNILLKIGFKILKDSEFVAYRKNNNEIIYHIVVARK